jgi:hypothetical protein
MLELYRHTLLNVYIPKGGALPSADKLRKLANDDINATPMDPHQTGTETDAASDAAKTETKGVNENNVILKDIQQTLKILKDMIEPLSKSTEKPEPAAADGGPPSAAVVAAADEYRNVPKAINAALTKFIELGMDQRHAAIAGIEEAQNNENELREMTNKAMDSIREILQEIPNTLRTAIADSDLSLIPQRIAELKITMEEHSNNLVSSSETTAKIMQKILEILSHLSPHILDTYDDITSINRELLRLNTENHDQLCDSLEAVKEILKPRLISIADEIKTQIQGENTLDLDEEDMNKIKSIVEQRMEQGTQTLLQTIDEINEAADHSEQEDALVSNETQTTEPDTESPAGGASATAPGSRINRPTGRRPQRSNLSPADAQKIKDSPLNRGRISSRKSQRPSETPMRFGRPPSPKGVWARPP